MAEEYKSYDSNDRYEYVGARLTKDPETRDGANGKMVRLQIVSTSRNKGKNGIIDGWVEVNVSDYDAEACSFLKKGDVLHKIEGKPYFREWGEPAKVSFCLERARVSIPLGLIATLKERGFKPGETSKKKPAKKAPRRDVQELPED